MAGNRMPFAKMAKIQPSGLSNFTPESMFQVFTGVPVPDPITFVVGEEWLNRPNIYPRQATLLKVIFLRTDLLTPYDHDVIDEWEEDFRSSNGHRGLIPGVRQKMALLKGLGYKWFREVLLVMGRRAGKGHIAALCMAYVLWNYLSKGDPQSHYGIDRDKKLASLIFAGKRDQAKATVFADLVNMVTGSTCFAPYISSDQTEKLSIYAPHDFVRMQRQADRGVLTERDQATFVIQPRESTVMAGRGPTAFMQAYDEAAHIVASGANRSAREVYDAAKPATDQFGKDAFIVHPSSPWQMLGMFYENWLLANQIDPETSEFLYPNMLSLQLASWDIYLDWEDTKNPHFRLFPEGFQGDLGEYVSVEPPRFVPLRNAIQTYDEQMRLEEKANPDTFKVERKAAWATALDAYLDEVKVKQIFDPWHERPEKYGPEVIQRQSRGILIHTYKGHADPSKVNDKFGICVAHTEYDAEGRAHCVIDLLHHFDPADFPDHTIDYEEVNDWLWVNVIEAFQPEEFTFDQYSSISSIQFLNKKIRNKTPSFQKHITVFEKTVTRQSDWKEKENTKAAINLGLVHCFPSTIDIHAERLELELKFLQLVNGRVDHPSSGPVQTKDLADAFSACVHTLIGEQVQNFLHSDLNSLHPGASLAGGVDPFSNMRPEGSGSRMADERINQLSAFGKARGRPEYTPSRNLTHRRNRGSRY